MRETLSIGPVPYEESCQQVGTSSYDPNAARNECRRFVALLEKKFPPVEGAHLKISSNPHDFGCYYDVEVVFEDTNPAAVDYAFNIESNTPARWEEETVHG